MVVTEMGEFSMLKYFHPLKIDVFKKNRLAKILELEAVRLKTQGYQVDYAKQLLNYIAYFGDWLKENGISVKHVDKETAIRFLEQFKPPKNPLPASRLKGVRCIAKSAVYSVVKHVEELYPESRLKTPIHREIHAFHKYLLDDLNLAKYTRRRYEIYLEMFLEYFFHGKRINLKALTPKMIRDYVDQVPSIVDERKKKDTCSMLNCYFRFSMMNGKKIGSVQIGIPSFHSSYNAPPAEMIERSEINILLDAIDRSSPVGKRTYASILCQIDLCMRIGEVSRIKLDDIDWRNGKIRVHNNKAREPYWLPLPKRVGQAIVDYLKNGRPKSKRREIFISHYCRRNHPDMATHLRRQVNLLWEKTGLNDRFSGTHLLRHYGAALMKQNDCSVKIISDILGHSSLQTTAIYAKVDIPHLRQIAQDWPGKEVGHDEN